MHPIPAGQSPERQPGSPWSIRDAAEFLRISPRHLIRLIEVGEVPSFKLGRRRFIADAELRRVAQGGAGRPAPPSEGSHVD